MPRNWIPSRTPQSTVAEILARGDVRRASAVKTENVAFWRMACVPSTPRGQKRRQKDEKKNA